MLCYLSNSKWENQIILKGKGFLGHCLEAAGPKIETG